MPNKAPPYQYLWHNLQQKRMRPDSRENPQNHRNAPSLQCVTTRVISRHTQLHAPIHVTLVTSHCSTPELQPFISNAHSIPLKYYLRYLPVIILTDASKHGLDTCLLHNGKSITFASKSLTDSETQYGSSCVIASTLTYTPTPSQ